ncbi:thioredoxin domain-containing protein [Sphingomonas sp. CL5.1]|uniref:DsbA family protein n=1 Tax=Sphingomonas sp. CL5.1 TaxID=2653203 RepID=UPI0015825705|nr:thioredoxin domain-containing protein [Sphingomonas sp. CL5.1]QKS01254.1 thioredoxin domain-containing protein [Sphingomonas sp. CL5.1]
MTKRLLPILALAFAAPLVAAPRLWTSVAAPAAQGSYVIGNPAARVKLVEYASYTCPHCGHFARDSAAVLKGKMIASGSLSLEIRSSIHDRYDLVAAMLAHCSGAAVFPKLHEALFARQEQWLQRAIDYDAANNERLGLYSAAAQYRAMAEGAGLDAIARDAGMTQAAIDQCLADPKVAETVIQRAEAIGGKIRGTPAFEINGKLIEGVDWAKLEPMLRAAGAK